MVCPHEDIFDGQEFLRQFRQRAVEQCIPLTGSIDLTHRCNLRCVHCYVRVAAGGTDLGTGQWKRVLDECTDAGCLSLLLTGGEPLLRPDFVEIYRHAKLKGLFVTVFTNGTLITDAILDLFGDLPPQGVEISLYGASEATYKRVTGVRGAYAQTIEGLERLLKRGVNVRLKTILMTHNRHEFPAIEKMAMDYGVKFRFDAALFRRLDGDPAPLALRVSPEEAVAREFATAGAVAEWREYLARQGEIVDSPHLYSCGAGVTGFHVDPYGNLQACLMVPARKFSLLNGGFAEGWRSITRYVRDRQASPEFPCRACKNKNLCGYCPGFFLADAGDEMARSEYLCAIGERRAEMLQRV